MEAAVIIINFLHIISSLDSGCNSNNVNTIELNRDEYDVINYDVEDFMLSSPFYQFQLETIKTKLISLEIKNATVLDAACGAGRWSRIGAQLGAKTVIGVDSSSIQIERAKSFNNSIGNTQIEYYVHNMNKTLPNTLINKFDIVINVHLLSHASNEQMVYNFYKNMRNALRNNDIDDERVKRKKYIITIMENYNQSPLSFPLHIKYGYVEYISADDLYYYYKYGYLKNGTQIVMYGYEPNNYQLTMWLYSKQLHEKYLKKVGFKNIEWFNFDCNIFEFYKDNNIRAFVKDYYDHQTDIGFIAELALI